MRARKGSGEGTVSGRNPGHRPLRSFAAPGLPATGDGTLASAQQTFDIV
jgi:hypothetical protein